MFRRLESTLPDDFDFPTDLEGLGYFVNEHDQVRMINNPSQGFHYFISRNNRYVERQKEAMNECYRNLIYERLSALGLNLTPLPLNTPVDQPHVPIWISKNIDTCKRLIVYIGESQQDLGLFAGRIMNEDGINEGSAVKFVQTAFQSSQGDVPDDEKPGIVIANPGQLLWHRRGKRAITWQSWYALKRNSAVGPGYEVTDANKIPKNEDVTAHVKCVFEEVVLPQGDRCGDRRCEIFVIGVGNTAHDVFEYLQANWAKCANKIQGLAILASNYVWQPTFYDGNFLDWFGRRARGYMVSTEALHRELQGRSRMGCNLYSGGEPHFVECLMRSSHAAILEYFKLISMCPGYANAPQDFDEPVKEEKGWGDEAETAQDEKEVSDGANSEETPKKTQSQAPTDVFESFAGLSLAGPSTGDEIQGRTISASDAAAAGTQGETTSSADAAGAAIQARTSVPELNIPVTSGSECVPRSHESNRSPESYHSAVENQSAATSGDDEASYGTPLIGSPKEPTTPAVPRTIPEPPSTPRHPPTAGRLALGDINPHPLNSNSSGTNGARRHTGPTQDVATPPLPPAPHSSPEIRVTGPNGTHAAGNNGGVMIAGSLDGTHGLVSRWLDGQMPAQEDGPGPRPGSSPGPAPAPGPIDGAHAQLHLGPRTASAEELAQGLARIEASRWARDVSSDSEGGVGVSVSVGFHDSPGSDGGVALPDMIPGENGDSAGEHVE